MKNIRKSNKNNEFKLSPPTWNDNLNYLTDHILYPVLKAIKILYHQQHETAGGSDQKGSRTLKKGD